MENFGKFMAFLFVIISSSLINGFVFLKLWEWFIVSSFDIHQIKFSEAIGIMFFINFLKFKPVKNMNYDFWKDFIKNIFQIVFMALFVLFVGLIISLFI